jgi:hypothetical protein
MKERPIKTVISNDDEVVWEEEKIESEKNVHQDGGDDVGRHEIEFTLAKRVSLESSFSTGGDDELPTAFTTAVDFTLSCDFYVWGLFSFVIHGRDDPDVTSFLSFAVDSP